MNIRSVSDVENELRSGDASARILYQLWELRDPIPEETVKGAGPRGSAEETIAWLHDPVCAQKFVRRALDVEEFLLVCDAATESFRLESRYGDSEAQRAFAGIRQDFAVALSRLGSTRRARLELEKALEPERARHLSSRAQARILTLLGNVLKDAAHDESTQAEREAGYHAALDAYRRALSLQAANLEAAIFSAVLRLRLRQETVAENEARAILHRVSGEETVNDSPFRIAVVRAAALAVVRDFEAARAAYAEVINIPGASTRQLAEARHRARFLAEAAELDPNFFDQCFPPLRLAVFSGHLPDATGRRSPRFPSTPEAIERVRNSIRKVLERLQLKVGFAAAAAGGDLLFLEEMLRLGGSVHVVLPWTREQFLGTSVLPHGEPWKSMFDKVLDQAVSVRELGETYKPSDPISLAYQTEVTAGLARMIGHAMHLDLVPLALWDGEPGLPGGTASFVSFWTREQKRKVEHIMLPRYANEAEDKTADRIAHAHEMQIAPRCEQPILEQHVKTMLFADIVGYSRLREQVIPDFVREFLGRVAELCSSSPYAPMSVNTWGDALFFVFDSAEDGGRFAIDLVRMIAERSKTWERAGLEWEDATGMHTLNVRIGLHTGPVYMHFDPVVRRLGFTGAHVNRAARIEPVTDVGSIFASEEFAALATLNRVEGFTCEFAGTMQLAKGFPGRHRIYRLAPVRTLPVERLARVVHCRYVNAMRERGNTPATHPAMREWEDLAEDLRAANRAQVADVEDKLRYLGYEIDTTFGILPTDMIIMPTQLEELARREHDRWMEERLSQGWTYGETRDDTQKKHPLLVPWEKLSEPEREKDRDAVRNVPLLLAEAGFRVRRMVK